MTSLTAIKYPAWLFLSISLICCNRVDDPKVVETASDNMCDTDTCTPEDCITASDGTRYCQYSPSTDPPVETDIPVETDPWQYSTDNCGTDACDPADCIDNICQR